ncbi:hypothetical protein SAMN02745136_04168 [Anaerocolumna jejuensis DSM 15929]|uniref:Uncharacterized protein n=1 Tax=Anaerocolumna jejuensis DSM 15929 TaxID=1121322 RepID=A0A1M6Y6B8_9FIRM|nr:hypothetical protein SAMN02745136_04168 [Anaerocolumna jejuensis DSM 15929]
MASRIGQRAEKPCTLSANLIQRESEEIKYPEKRYAWKDKNP